ncbi:hypothetical protein [Thermaerobacillus caldiproteolyticus]|uniref:Uncharacterized protein n=1 Tax=Thermaerobacillus caldiproteolyticus TaxID=247480 RepID=A0A7V9Z472_9BACL|nr:hypothetical protein [Anoxybacillus caldiproteolyticus]MBA2873747.1 hypothetical protein [Anoxybacillus caldiproteolyticus]
MLRSYFLNKNCYAAIAPFDVRFALDDDYEHATNVVHYHLS